MTMLQHGVVPSTGGYRIERSLRFNSADSAYLNRTPGSAGNRKTFTIAGRIKRSSIGAISSASNAIVCSGTNTSDDFSFYFRTDDTIDVLARVSSSIVLRLITTQVFRDVSAWYDIVLAIDTTQATDTNRAKLYVNGTQVTAFSSTTYPSQNQDLNWNNAVDHQVGRLFNQFGGSSYFNGYLADVHLIDGSALTPSSFGENDTDTGVWKPKAYTGSYGTNGFKLTFSDNSGTTATTLGKDTSGNGNNWTPNNFSVTAGAGNDSLVDTPTPYGTDTGAGGQVRGNYCVINPLDKNTNILLANGNLDASLGAVSAWYSARSTFGMSSGKWYWEITSGTISDANNQRAMLGIMTASASLASYVGSDANGWGYYSQGGKYSAGNGVSYGASYGTNDIIGVAFDADAGSITFYKNGISQGVAYSGLAANTYFPAIGLYSATSYSISANFGQRPFAYTAPSGFKALCTTNLPTPTIGATSSTRADDYFNTVLYTGDSSYPRAITGVGFQPDFVWIKTRSAAYSHVLYDAVRGTGTTKSLYTDDTAAEGTNSSFANLSSFDSDGFTIGSTSSTNILNNSPQTRVAWNWKANGAGSSNTAGSITSTVSANTTAGFSIVTCSPTGSAFTVGHGLGVAPRFIIAKLYQSTADWNCYHASLGANKYIVLNSTSAALTSTTLWQNTAPTSTVLSFAAVSSPMLFYCFAEVAGYSAFGSYTGNGSADGPFIYTGFRPRYIMVKGSTATTNWTVIDTARDTYNACKAGLYQNLSNAESDPGAFDILSNGFKIRHTYTDSNGNGNTYIYMALAEVPAKFSLAR